MVVMITPVAFASIEYQTYIIFAVMYVLYPLLHLDHSSIPLLHRNIRLALSDTDITFSQQCFHRPVRLLLLS